MSDDMDVEEYTTRSGRRSGRTLGSGAQNALAKIREIQSGRKKKSELLSVDMEEDVYEEVDEQRYREIVKERRAKGDFVVHGEDQFDVLSDGDDGYADDGEEYWDQGEATAGKKRRGATLC